jgi:crotonobetaine/carnitine-CoA ligase
LIGSLLRRRATAAPDRLFAWCGDERISYGDLDDRAARLTAGLRRLGVAAGDRLSVIAPNRREMLELYFGCANAGVIQVPTNVYLKGDFLAHQLRDAMPEVVVVDAAGYAALRRVRDRTDFVRHVVLLDAVDIDGEWARRTSHLPYAELTAGDRDGAIPLDDPATTMSIIYTSGTTGLPKGCLTSHAYYLRVGRLLTDLYELTEDDRVMTAMPLFHAGGRTMVVATALYSGGSAVIESAFRPSTFMPRAGETGATVIGGVGAMAEAILNQPPTPSDRDHAVRIARFNPMTAARQAEFEQRFGVEVVCEMYGQSECVPISFGRRDEPRQPDSIGRPAPDLDVRLVDGAGEAVAAGDLGEIVLRAKHPGAMFTGYWHRPDEDARSVRDGWYHTGDLGRTDEDGYLYYVDRKKDMVRRRGENISARQTEQAITAFPGLAEVAIHAVPSEMSEDEVKACLVLEPDAHFDVERFAAFCRDALPYFAIPRYVEVVAELPKTPSMRVMKHILAERGVNESTYDLEALELSVPRDQRRAGAL